VEKYITDFKEINNDGDYAISVAVHQIESGKLEDMIDLSKKTGFKSTSMTPIQSTRSLSAVTILPGKRLIGSRLKALPGISDLVSLGPLERDIFKI